MRLLSWSDFDEAVWKISAEHHGRAFNGVYGFPRGGLCLAVALSHHLELPLLLEPEEDSLIVDDIYETGRTLTRLKNLPGCEAIVWISKARPTWFRAVEVIDSPEWIVFPWEDPEAAAADEEAYRASRE